MDNVNKEELIFKLQNRLKVATIDYEAFVNTIELKVDCYDLKNVIAFLPILEEVKEKYDSFYSKYFELNQQNDKYTSIKEEMDTKYFFYHKLKEEKSQMKESSCFTSIESRRSNVSNNSKSSVENTKLQQDKMKSSLSKTSSTSFISKIGSQLSSDSNTITKYEAADRKLEKSSLSSVLSCSLSSKSSCQIEDLKTSKLQQMNIPSSTNVSNTRKCKFCLESHEIFACNLYLSNAPRKRFDITSKLRLCRNCLRPGHKANNCRNEKRCKECNKKHYTTLHFNKSSSTDPDYKDCSKNTRNIKRSQKSLIPVPIKKVEVVRLSTVRILIPDAKGNWQSIEAIVDTASNKNLLKQNELKFGIEHKMKNQESARKQSAENEPTNSSVKAKRSSVEKLSNHYSSHKKTKDSNNHQKLLNIHHVDHKQKVTSKSISDLAKRSYNWRVVKDSHLEKNENVKYKSTNHPQNMKSRSVEPCRSFESIVKSRGQSPVEQFMKCQDNCCLKKNEIVERCSLRQFLDNYNYELVDHQ